MSSKWSSWTTVALGLGSVAVASLVMLGAGQQPRPAAIDNDDIGGVVTGAQGPEAGVWVIAETREHADAPDQERRHRRSAAGSSFPICRAREYDVWVRGYGLVDSPKVKATPGKIVEPQGGRRARQEGRGAVLPGAVLVRAAADAAEERFPRHRREGQRHLAEHQEPGRVDPQHRQHRRLHRLPSDGRRGDAHDSEEHPRQPSTDSKAAWDRRIQSGQAGGGMSARFTQVGRQRALGDVCGLDRSHRRRASCRRRRRSVRRAASATSSSRCGTGRIRRSYLHDEIASDKRNPTVNANGPIYGALEESGDYLPVIDPKTNTASQIKLIVARSRHAELRRSAAGGGRRRTGATKRSGTARRRSTASRWTSRGASGPRRASASRRRRPGAARDRIIRRRSCSRSTRASAGWRCTTRRRRQLTTIDTCFTWGHVNFDDNDVLWSSFGPAGVEGWFDIKDLGQDARREAGAGLERVRPRQQRQRQARRYTEPNQPADPTKDRRLNVQFYGDSPASDGSVWGTVQGMPGALGALRARRASAGDGADRDLRSAVEQPEGADAGLRAARHGRRQQGRRVDGALERTARQLRSQQVQGPARTVRPRPASTAPKGGRSIRCRARTTRARSTTPAPTRRTTTSSIASTCSASARTCRSRPAISRKGCSRSSTASS